MDRSTSLTVVGLRMPSVDAIARGTWVAAPLLLLGVSLRLWILAIPDIEPRSMTDLGLISVLPPALFAALGTLLLAFFAAIHAPRTSPLVCFLSIVMLILLLYGTVPIVEGLPRTEAAWRHIGYIEYITRNHGIDPTLNAYFNWPGFFSGGALFVEAAGLPDAVQLARWAPLAFDFLYIGPLLLIFRTVARDERIAWMALWVYFTANWVAQDYFSPQGFALLIHFAIVAILVRWFTGPPPSWVRRFANAAARFRPASGDAGVAPEADKVGAAAVARTRAQRMLLATIAVLLCATIVASHQLTPFVTLATSIGLVAIGGCRLRSFPILLSAMIVAWVSYCAIQFMLGNLMPLLSDVGRVESIVSSNVTERFQGSAEHIFVNRMRIILTLTVWVVATLGAIRRARAGRLEPVPMVIAAAPFPLLALQAYGGEMMLRVYLFALPGMAVLAVRLPFPRQVRWTSIWVRLATVPVAFGVIIAFLLARYGNERMDYFTHEEDQAMRYFQALTVNGRAPTEHATADDPGPLVVVPSWDLPLRFHRDDMYSMMVMDIPALRDAAGLPAGDPESLAALVAGRPHDGAYLIVTRSEKAHLQLTTGLSPARFDRLVADLIDSGEARVVYRNRDATILVLNEEAGG